MIYSKGDVINILYKVFLYALLYIYTCYYYLTKPMNIYLNIIRTRIWLNNSRFTIFLVVCAYLLPVLIIQNYLFFLAIPGSLPMAAWLTAAIRLYICINLMKHAEYSYGVLGYVYGTVLAEDLYKYSPKLCYFTMISILVFALSYPYISMSCWVESIYFVSIGPMVLLCTINYPLVLDLSHRYRTKCDSVAAGVKYGRNENGQITAIIPSFAEKTILKNDWDLDVIHIVPKNHHVSPSAFKESPDIKHLIIEPGARIAPGSFESCPNLKSLQLPSDASYYPANVFDGCDNLETILQPRGLKIETKNPLYKFLFDPMALLYSFTGMQPLATLMGNRLKGQKSPSRVLSLMDLCANVLIKQTYSSVLNQSKCRFNLPTQMGQMVIASSSDQQIECKVFQRPHGSIIPQRTRGVGR